ncbi:hypothetical protein WBP07_21750 (plasmid) [Novosphingobium sp. BL-8A]|uniref:hypothetical protein n=1 Tax=Novosphingobium sp. BL-8A TaxID=3127639 RepID=UPI0037563904
MRWSKDGVMEPTSIFEAASLQRSVRAVCGCGHASHFEAHCLWWHFQRRGWNDRFGPARNRFWCRVCRSNFRKKIRPVKLESASPTKGDFELPWPDERRWKEEMRRVR